MITSMARTAPREQLRERMFAAALQALEAGGPEAVQVRGVATAAGASTQAVYTVFGGMPGLFEALIVDGFSRFAHHIASVPETEDPVSDHFAKGGAYVDWALAHPQLYRLMFGLTGGALRAHPGLEMTMSGSLANFPEGRAAADVLIRSLDRVKTAGRIRGDQDTVLIAGQFLSATHGFVLLAIAGAFADLHLAAQIIVEAGINLMVGLGDDPAACRRSAEDAMSKRRLP